MKITKYVQIGGRVQGVGFRYFTRKNAERIGITGWVRNLPGGNVEAVIQGTQKQVEEMMALLHKGPQYSHVSNVDVIELESADEFQSFEVRY